MSAGTWRQYRLNSACLSEGRRTLIFRGSGSELEGQFRVPLSGVLSDCPLRCHPFFRRTTMIVTQVRFHGRNSQVHRSLSQFHQRTLQTG